MSDIAIVIEEHKQIDIDNGSEHINTLARLLDGDNYNPKNPHDCMGLDWGNRSRTSIKASYFVGVKWIEEGKSAICVKPKIENVDFLSMFMRCFDNECSDVASKLGDIYHISFNEKPIVVDHHLFELTPMLIVHFLKLLERIVKKGIKRDYTQIEENLTAKIKGKVKYGKTILCNHSIGRNERVICNYQHFTEDCIENRILKKVLRFVEKYLMLNHLTSDKELKHIASNCMKAFANVSDSISTQSIKQFRLSPMYKEYNEALKVAKMILQRFGYAYDKINENIDALLPPFWIDMSLLFELYVYSLLKSTYHHQIAYHIGTYGNEVDFVKYDENLIIDTKYSLCWEERVNHDNVRQLSGYARNVSLREKIMKVGNDETTILPCLIIYPDMTIGKPMEQPSILLNAIGIDSYLKFNKLPIALPIK